MISVYTRIIMFDYFNVHYFHPLKDNHLSNIFLIFRSEINCGSYPQRKTREKLEKLYKRWSEIKKNSMEKEWFQMILAQISDIGINDVCVQIKNKDDGIKWVVDCFVSKVLFILLVLIFSPSKQSCIICDLSISFGVLIFKDMVYFILFFIIPSPVIFIAVQIKRFQDWLLGTFFKLKLSVRCV